MKFHFLIFLSLTLFVSCSFEPTRGTNLKIGKSTDSSYLDLLKDGDLIFQTSNSGQSLAIQKATDSKYSHVGMVFKINGEWMVFEAVQPVQRIPIKDFINRGDNGHFTISRLKNENQLDEKSINEMKLFFEKIEGKNYDIYFEWSDKAWYCSELVWKMYHHVGIAISPYEKFGQYNLNDPIVKQIIQERFKNGVNLDETVITPRGLFESTLMEEIFTNYD